MRSGRASGLFVADVLLTSLCALLISSVNIARVSLRTFENWDISSTIALWCYLFHLSTRSDLDRNPPEGRKTATWSLIDTHYPACVSPIPRSSILGSPTIQHHSCHAITRDHHWESAITRDHRRRNACCQIIRGSQADRKQSAQISLRR